MPAKPLITAKRLREVLDYDPDTGIFTALIARGKIKPGDILGFPGGFKSKYLIAHIDGRKYLLQRLAWLYKTGEWPKEEVDHMDRTETNNRWENLREATRSQNAANRGHQTNNTSGHIGVSWHKKSQKWQAYIKHGGVEVYLGSFESIDDAVERRRKAAIELHGEFASERPSIAERDATPPVEKTAYSSIPQAQ